ncbi:MAG: hypothetical protein ACRD3V_16785 [Vicinamibacteria bacterium]
MRFSATSILLASGCLSFGCLQDNVTEPTSSVRVVQAGWSFGFCIGPCRGDMGIEGVALSYRISDRTEQQVFAINRGRLTASGAARIDTLAQALPADLLDQYGCPDCADGGASYFVVDRESGSERTEYEHGNPPPELAAIDGYLASVMEALRECRVTPDLTPEPGCTPQPS